MNIKYKINNKVFIRQKIKNKIQKILTKNYLTIIRYNNKMQYKI